MKTKWFFTGILSIMLVFGLFLTGCDNGSDDGTDPGGNNGGNPFVGTWVTTDSYGDTFELIITSSRWSMPFHGPEAEGTYSRTGNSAILYDKYGGEFAATVSGNTLSVYIYEPLTFSKQGSGGGKDETSYTVTFNTLVPGGEVSTPATVSSLILAGNVTGQSTSGNTYTLNASGNITYAGFGWVFPSSLNKSSYQKIKVTVKILEKTRPAAGVSFSAKSAITLESETDVNRFGETEEYKNDITVLGGAGQTKSAEYPMSAFTDGIYFQWNNWSYDLGETAGTKDPNFKIEVAIDLLSTGTAVTVPSQTVTSGGKATKPTNPIRSGYIFDNWYSNSGLTTLYDFNTPVTGNITLYAKWISSSDARTVTFNSNGGSSVPTQTITSGGTATRPSDPARSGYTFDNWYSNEGLTTVYNFSTPVTSNITLYAKWTNSSGVYTVKFESNGGSTVSNQTVTSGGTATRPTNPTRSGGYTFDNWYSNSALTTVYNFSTPVTSDITIYAKWNASYTVTFNSNSGSTVQSQTVASGGIATRPSDPTRSGYDFGGWYSNSGLTTMYNFSTPVTSNITLYAKWDTPVNGGTATSTLYVGLLGFNNSMYTRNIRPLNSGSSSQFTSFIDGLVIGNGTGLYYAVDNAIDMLEAAVTPSDLTTVALVTFTDGLDNVSIGLNNYYLTNDLETEDYRNDIIERLDGKTIKTVPLNAYSVGIRGGDVTDAVYPDFLTGFKAVSSTPNLELTDPDTKAFLAADMDQVNDIFEGIAGDLYRSSQLQTLTLEIPVGVAVGSQVRYTFDDISADDIASSTLYIEGTLRRSGGVPYIENVIYHGLSSSSGTTITATASTKPGKNGYFEFYFENISTPTGNLSLDYVQLGKTTGGVWGPESEFIPDEGSELEVVSKSALIIIVLDCTTSLNAGGLSRFQEMQTAAKRFIQILVEAQQP